MFYFAGGRVSGIFNQNLQNSLLALLRGIDSIHQTHAGASSCPVKFLIFNLFCLFTMVYYIFLHYRNTCYRLSFCQLDCRAFKLSLIITLCRVKNALLTKEELPFAFSMMLLSNVATLRLSKHFHCRKYSLKIHWLHSEGCVLVTHKNWNAEVIGSRIIKRSKTMINFAVLWI